jgi:hypothetical protein
MAKVFFSYSHKDEELRDALERRELHANVTRNHRCATLPDLLRRVAAFLRRASPYPGTKVSLMRAPARTAVSALKAGGIRTPRKGSCESSASALTRGAPLHSLLRASHSGSRPTHSSRDQSRPRGGRRARRRGAALARAAAMPRTPGRARIVSRRPVRRQAPGARPRMVAVHDRAARRMISRAFGWGLERGRVSVPAQASAGVSIFGHGQAGAGALPRGWDVSRPCIVRETPSTPCCIRSSPAMACWPRARADAPEQSSIRPDPPVD